MIGKPKHFDVEHALETVRQLVSADEVITALELLDKFPAFYRENPTTSMILCKENIYRKIATIQDYYKGEWIDIDVDNIVKEYDTPRYMRCKVVEQLVEFWNKQERIPYICELGPGQYWTPIGMKSKGLRFTYKPITITGGVLHQAIDYLGSQLVTQPEFNQPHIFVCMEVIEHMFNLGDVYNYYYKEGLNAEHVVISTPKFCLGGGYKRDHADMIAHVRTFTTDEFMSFCKKGWPQLSWQYLDGETQIGIGSRING